MKKFILILLVLMAILCLSGCNTKADYLQGKLDKREADRISKEQFSKEAKGSNVWWNSQYESRNTNRHLNNDQFGFN